MQAGEDANETASGSSKPISQPVASSSSKKVTTEPGLSTFMMWRSSCFEHTAPVSSRLIGSKDTFLIPGFLPCLEKHGKTCTLLAGPDDLHLVQYPLDTDGMHITARWAKVSHGFSQYSGDEPVKLVDLLAVQQYGTELSVTEDTLTLRVTIS